MKKRLKISFSTTHIIMLSFFLVIMLGSLLLSLPISSASGESIPYVDALFTATTSVCVTGLVTMPVISTWSTFGHIVILILIQIGGLGVITIMAGIMIAINKRLGMRERLLMQDAFNLDTLSGLVSFTKKVIKGTFVVEGVGALGYMLVFVPEFGVKGIWISIFNSISAFCNAGIDIIADNSLCNYAVNPIINIVTSLLIILGGIGYIVWWDVLRVLKTFKTMKFKCFRQLTLHSKIAIWSSAILIFGGAILIFAFEYNNPLTIKDLALFEKIETSLFQSITTRTAGFATLPQENFTDASAFLCLLLMFIGGSPVGTAGGVKTVTFAVLILSMIATIRNENQVTIMNRNIPKQAISKSVAVVCMSFAIMFIATVSLAAVTDASAMDIAYETVSATATVGLTRSLTPLLNIWGKLIIICTMFLGRVGPISLAVAFRLKKEKSNIIKNPTEEIRVG